MKKILCYFAIVLLITLIVLPPALRIFVKDDYEEELPKDVVELLSCTKTDESISMPYKNGVLTMIKYSFKEQTNSDIFSFNGDTNNYGDVNETETIKSVLEKNTNTQKETNNGEVTYKLEMNESNSVQIADTYKGSSEVMKNYYTNLGYSCNIIK